MAIFSDIGSAFKKSSLWLLGVWILVSTILFFIWFGSTLDIPSKYDDDTKVKDAKNAAKGFGVTFLIPFSAFLIYLAIKQIN